MNQVTKLVIAATIVICGGAWYLWQDKPNQAAILAIVPKVDNQSAVKIVAFGDSLTAGYGLPQSESYPAQLEVVLKANKYSVSVINAGVSGETSRGNLERAAFIRSQNPDIVLLGIGGNDALRLLPVAETRKNLTETISILQAGENPPVIIVLAMQAPLNVGLSYKKEFDSLYESIATETGSILVPFITTEVFLNSANKLSDGIHLNKDGYAKVIELYLLPVLIEILDTLLER
jgi:acyl-CoA thioesterase I